MPIWKRETWEGGEHWAVDAQHIVDIIEANQRHSDDPEIRFGAVSTDRQVGVETSGDDT